MRLFGVYVLHGEYVYICRVDDENTSHLSHLIDDCLSLYQTDEDEFINFFVIKIFKVRFHFEHHNFYFSFVKCKKKDLFGLVGIKLSSLWYSEIISQLTMNAEESRCDISTLL